MPATIAFIDDSGGTSLEGLGERNSRYFVVSAILVSNENLADVRRHVEQCRLRLVGPGEMKSARIGSRTDRRVRHLSELSHPAWKCYALAVDKSFLSKDSALAYKRSFIKFLHSRLFRQLVASAPEISIVADEHGSAEFMRGFEDYYRRNFNKTLFDASTFEFRSSREEILIQVADVVAGSLRRILEERPPGNESTRILEQLRPQLLGVDSWPPVSRLRDLPEPVGQAAPEDTVVSAAALDAVNAFLTVHAQSEDEDRRRQVAALSHLLFVRRFGSQSRYVSTARLRTIAALSVPPELEQRSFRNRVIAPMRDEGVLLGSSRTGLKIPESLHDLVEYVEHDHRILEPMLQRLARARRAILLASRGGVDIVSGDHVRYLRELIDNLGLNR